MSEEPEFQAHVLCEICLQPLYWRDAEQTVNGTWVCKPHTCISGNRLKEKPK